MFNAQAQTLVGYVVPNERVIVIAYPDVHWNAQTAAPAQELSI